MKTSSPNVPSASCVSLSRRVSQWSTVLGVAALIISASSTMLAQVPDAGKGGRRQGGGGGDRGNFNPQEMQTRMLNAVRERLEVTDDEEWKVISERIAKVSELRRSTGGGIMGMVGGRGGPPGGGGGDRTAGRGGRPGGGSPELAALSTAVRDKLPDAEIKARLERVREARRTAEDKLAKAQEELRAVLSVRQEAVAVVFGLLP